MKLLTPIVFLILALVGVIWLDAPEPPADLTIANSNETFTLDPQRMSWMQDFRLAYAVYEGLVRWNLDDYSIRPAAARTLPDASDDGLRYQFTIRDDARWSNGANVTAHDFIASWQRAILPDTAADYTMLFFCIRGARDFFDWRTEQLRSFAQAAHADPARASEQLWNETQSAFDEMVGLRAIDDHTLAIELEHPTPYLLDLLAFGPFHPVYRPSVEGWQLSEAEFARMIGDGWHALADPPWEERQFVSLDAATGRLRQDHEWTQPEHHIGNGPYLVASWRYKRGMRLERNPMYHSPNPRSAASIRIISISEANTAVLAFARGEIDWLTDIGVDYEPELIAQVQQGTRNDVHVLPTFGTEFFSFNCRPTLSDGRANPFHHAGVRRAFALATDRQLIVDQVTRLSEPVATTFIPPDSIPGYTSPQGLGFDVERARAEFAAVGWIDRDGDGKVEDEHGRAFPAVDLLYSTGSTRYKNICLTFRDMWERNLGVEVVLRSKESKTFKEDLKHGNFMIARGRWYGDYGDPTTFLDIFRSGDGNNDRGYADAEVDAQLKRAAAMTDAAARMQVFHDVEERLFNEEVPLLVLCHLVQLYMYDPERIQGLSSHPRLTQYLDEIEVVESQSE
ncbi:MAG: peptide ABC transporter substrate-binding protein [Phycisphaerales bacterium]